MEIFCAQFSGGGAKLVFLKKNLVKKGVSEKKMCTFFLGSFGFTSLLLHHGTRCFRRVCKKDPIKIGFFWHTLFLDAEETEKRRKKKGPKKSNTQFLGGLENGQEVVPPFFFKKAMLQRGQT